jgi:hypothetical protein
MHNKVHSVSSFSVEYLREKYSEGADIKQIKPHNESLSQFTDSVRI